MSEEQSSGSGWHAKRIAALVLMLALAALAVYIWRAGVGDGHILLLLSVGVLLGVFYVMRGGSLPEFVYRGSESHFAGGTGITADDDPRNISPRIYLPVLIIVVVAAAALYFFYAPRR